MIMGAVDHWDLTTSDHEMVLISLLPLLDENQSIVLKTKDKEFRTMGISFWVY